MSPTALPVVAEHDRIAFPIRLADSGGARRLLPLHDVAFEFTAAGARFRTRARSRMSRVDLEISAELGRLPFSVQSRAARDQAIALLARPPAGARPTLTESSTVTIAGALTLDGDITPVRLVAALTEWVVDLQPWLRAIAAPLAAARLRRPA